MNTLHVANVFLHSIDCLLCLLVHGHVFILSLTEGLVGGSNFWIMYYVAINIHVQDFV